MVSTVHRAYSRIDFKKCCMNNFAYNLQQTILAFIVAICHD